VRTSRKYWREVWVAIVLVAITLTAASRSLAVQPDEILSDRALELRARTLSRELRCMVCQNQSIDDSDAPLARDLRLLVRERLQAGDSDTQVLDFLSARYGQFVLLKPRFGWDTAMLWLAPAVALLLGIGGLVALLRRRRADAGGVEAEPPQLTPAERGRLADLLRDTGTPTGPPA
jgi:cytochrome c-type biogenesis protein CcmH